MSFQDPFQEAVHSVATDQSQEPRTPARDVAEAHRAADACDFIRGCAAGVRRGNDRARADTGDAVNRETESLKDLKRACVSNTAGAAPSYCNAVSESGPGLSPIAIQPGLAC